MTRTSLYPDDVFTSATGDQSVGLDANGKYTNGTVSPYTPPSRVPASQFNLLNDLLGEMIAGARLTPNNTDTKQLVNALRHTNRFMEWNADVDYEYGDIVSARLFGGLGMTRLYKCSSNHTGVDPRTSSFGHWYNLGEQAGTLLYLPYTPTPSIDGYIQLNGAYIGNIPEYTRLRSLIGDYLPDMRGRVARAVGGEASGLLQPQDDAMQRMTGEVSEVDSSFVGLNYATGVFGLRNQAGRRDGSGSTYHTAALVDFDSARQTRTANETRVKSMGWVACIVI